MKKLNEHDIDVKLIEIDKNKNMELTKDEISHLVFGNADDRELLLEVGIKSGLQLL